MQPPMPPRPQSPYTHPFIHPTLRRLAQLVQLPAAAALPDLYAALLRRCAALMAKAPARRADFVTAGGLAALQARVEALPCDAPAAEAIAACLRLFPEVGERGTHKECGHVGWGSLGMAGQGQPSG